VNFDRLKDWIGRTEEQADIAAAAPLAGLAATLDHIDPPWRPGEVPPLGHWLYFLPRVPQRDIGPDGHPKRGGFLPPVELPRRMWAGGEFEFLAPIPLGTGIMRWSTIADVEHKAGRSGDMLFVRVVHEISAGGAVAIREVHNIVYREAAKPGGEVTSAAEARPPHPNLLPSGKGSKEAASLPEGSVVSSVPSPEGKDRTRGDSEKLSNPEFQREVVPDPVLLFRYSALTFNGHRIHYDRSYCEQVEGYPGLIVHGPLTATLLMDLYLRQRPAARVTTFRFRARRPLFDIHPFTVCGEHKPHGASLWALDHEGAVAMTAELEAS
jgi:3-methylfumaryl-CoA hydratase